MANRLAEEQSPYLLQHQNNPVDWYPWDEEAFEQARLLDRPIFLSIGYSTCHWCHVMEHESFEDEAVAALMNAAFVNIKVDREERPDIDNIYMAVCQLMGRHCGWPLNVLLLPDGRPFYVTTYLPKRTRGGRLGMLDFIPRIEQLWREKRDEIVASAAEVSDALAQLDAPAAASDALDPALTRIAYNQLAQRFDQVHGGFGRAPKFPSPHTLLFLLRYWKRTGEAQALTMVTHTLNQLRRSGTFDQVGYGVHRYATDQAWRVPHFEKMLYDQALLVMAYTEAFQATGEKGFERTARDVCAYVLRDMTSPEGGFYSAEDADSEGEEGKFYVWRADELDAVLDPELARLVKAVYSIDPEGNYLDEATQERTGANILYQVTPIAAQAEALDMPPFQLEAMLEAARMQLFATRKERIHPHKDDKVLVDWNGLMIAALAKAGRAFGEPAFLQAAERASSFVLATMQGEDGRLKHRYRGGQAAIDGHVDDYAFLTWGVIELYLATGQPEHLNQAMRLTEMMLAIFWDEDRGALYFTAPDRSDLLIRKKEYYDGAVPSANSIAFLNLQRMAHLTGRTDWAEYADQIGRVVAPHLAEVPSGFTGMLLGLEYQIGPAFQVVLAGTGDLVAPFKRELDRSYRPHLTNHVIQSTVDIAALVPFIADFPMEEGKAVAYVCQSNVCQQPTGEVSEMMAQLGQSTT